MYDRRSCVFVLSCEPMRVGHSYVCDTKKKKKNQSIRTRIKQAKTNERRGGKKNKGNNNNTNEARKTKQNIRYSIYVCAKFTSPPGEGPVGFYLETLVKQSVQTHLSLFPGPKLLIWLYATIYCIVKNWFCASQGWKKTTMQHLTWCSLHLKVYGMMVWCHKQPFSTALTHLRETSTAKSWMTPPSKFTFSQMVQAQSSIVGEDTAVN